MVVMVAHNFETNIISSAIGGQDSVMYYEGCGHEGPVRCIFFCEFHPVVGPKITCQTPEDYVSKEIFDAVSVYIIPKPQLQRSILTVTVQYEPVVKKISDYLTMMEEESGFLSEGNFEDSSHNGLSSMLQQIMNDMNACQISTVIEGTTTMNLKVVKSAPDPFLVMDHLVPIFTVDKNSFHEDQWDLTTQQVLPYIDGFNHVAKIAAEADVENNLVKACVQNLIYYRVVSLIPIFQYSNVYTPTPKIKQLTTNVKLQEECLKYVSNSDDSLPTVRDVFVLYTKMTHGATIRDLCIRYNPREHCIDERKLIQFGLLQKIIRRIQKYPIYMKPVSQTHKPNTLQESFTGLFSFDEICCNTGLIYTQLDEIVESDPDVIVIWK